MHEDMWRFTLPPELDQYLAPDGINKYSMGKTFE